MINPSDAISTNLRLELVPLDLDWEACFDTPNIVPHHLGVKANDRLYTPSSLTLSSVF